MTPTEVNLVKQTWSDVVQIKDAAAELFYGRLFALNPKIKPMFGHDMKEQGDKLMATLDVVVYSLDKLDTTLPAVRALAIRHVGYGVRPEHYEAVGAALLWTLEKGLGPAFTADVRNAWVAVYGTLSHVMQEAAYSAPAAS
jgi:hemoglobin-like flavoprotein